MLGKIPKLQILKKKFVYDKGLSLGLSHTQIRL